MAVVGAENEENAKKEFARKYMCDGIIKEEHIQQCVTHFCYGIKAYEFHSETHHAEIKELLKDFFSQSVIDSMFHAEKAQALHEFHFKLYNNYS
jgi:hypothetical protein